MSGERDGVFDGRLYRPHNRAMLRFFSSVLSTYARIGASGGQRAIAHTRRDWPRPRTVGERVKLGMFLVRMALAQSMKRDLPDWREACGPAAA